MILQFLSIYGQLHKVIHLSLGALDVSLLNLGHLSYYLMRLLLILQSFPVITELIVRMCNRLIARNDLQVFLPEYSHISGETFQEAVDCRLEMLEILIHKP